MITRKLDKDLASEEMKAFAYQLLHGPLYVPDCMRDYKPLLKALKRVVDEPLSILMGAYNDAEELGGVYGIINVMPETDARFVFWLWDKSAWSKALVRECRDLIAYVKSTYELRRVTAQAASDELSDLLQLIGFKVEGRFRSGYKHDGKFHNLYQLRVIGEL